MNLLGQNQPTPKRPGAYVRISSDPLGEERGIDRQIADTKAKAKQLGWGTPIVYAENDTSAFRRRKIELPDGTTAMRVVRPNFRQALEDLKAGTIDGLLVYDIDRLVRDPRDLEDLVDVCVEHQRPVQAVTTNLDLLSPDGQVMARMLVNFAHKSSQDTSRRVARAKVERALQGKVTSARRTFGWQEGNEKLDPKESAGLRDVIDHILNGGSLADGVRILEGRGIKPVRAKKWSITALRVAIARPAIAGIASYRGKAYGRPVRIEHWRESALRDKDGQYIKGEWEALITPEEWEAVNTIIESRSSPRVARDKSLLTGTLRCGKCGAKLTTAKSRIETRKYACAASLGCGGIVRNMDMVDDYITAVISARLAAIGEIEVEKETTTPNKEVVEIQARIDKLRSAYTEGTISDETFFTMIPQLEERLATARKESVKVTKTRHSTLELQEAWDDPNATTMWRRTVIDQLILAVKVLPAQRGRRIFNPEKEIEIVWR